MFKKTVALSFFTFLAFVSAPAVSFAAQPQQTGEHGDWKTYILSDGGQKICYMVSKPVKAEGKYTNRGEVFALITHRPAEKTKDVFSYITGYTYKPGSDATVTIDGNNYVLFTQDDTAWAPDAVKDAALAKAIRSGSKMVVKGTSARGTFTSDTYSLKGSGDAYKMISSQCGVDVQ